MVKIIAGDREGVLGNGQTSGTYHSAISLGGRLDDSRYLSPDVTIKQLKLSYECFYFNISVIQ